MYQGYERVFDHKESIILHRPEDFKGMRRAGRLAAETLDFVTPYVQPGITTEALDRLCHDFIVSHHAIPAPLGYKGYPKSICTSLNHVVCHGIPGERILHDGDILNIDVTVIVDGWHGDTSRMFTVGRHIPLKAVKLIDATYAAMMRAIDLVKPGVCLGDIGHAIQATVEPLGFSVVRDFIGHGLGQCFHMPPAVPHFGQRGEGVTLKPGMFLTIEPMINAGKHGVKILPDQWTAVTKDKSLSAQFEHSLGVTETGCEVFTFSPRQWFCPPYIL